MRTIGGTRTLAALALSVAGCAGATIGSGVGDRYLEHPPWYAGSGVPPGAAVRHLPVSYQRGGSQPEPFDPAGGALPYDISQYDALGRFVTVGVKHKF